MMKICRLQLLVLAGLCTMPQQQLNGSLGFVQGGISN